MSRTPSADRVTLWLFVIALVFVAFVSGVVSTNYRLRLARPVLNALAAADALRDQWSHPRQSNATGAAFMASVEGSIRDAHVSWQQGKAFEGYTAIAVRYSTRVYLLDMRGQVVHRWDVPFEKAFPNPTHVHGLAKAVVYVECAHVFPNGDLLVSYTGWRDTPYGYGLAKVDRDSRVLWTYAANAHHGFSVDPETGNIHALVQAFVDAPIAGLPGLAVPVLADSLVTLAPDGRETRRIALLDAFRDSPYASMVYHKPISGLDWDPLHTNAVEPLQAGMARAFPMFRPGDLLVSMRNMNTVAVIDPASRQVVWAYDGLWQGQHAAHFLPNGRILLLDNFGVYSAGQPFSRVLEFDPVTMRIAWQFAGGPDRPFYTYAYGRTQRLPNGNTLVAETLGSRVFEVASDGEIVWDYRLPQVFGAFNPALPPYRTNISRAALADPAFAESYRTIANLGNAVVDATRYAAGDLPFVDQTPGPH